MLHAIQNTKKHSGKGVLVTLVADDSLSPGPLEPVFY